jgi:hypothetical protein
VAHRLVDVVLRELARLGLHRRVAEHEAQHDRGAPRALRD